jgi:hypothetical protein
LQRKLDASPPASARRPRTGSAPCTMAGHAHARAAPPPSGTTSTRPGQSCWIGRTAITISGKSPATTSTPSQTPYTATNAVTRSASYDHFSGTAKRKAPSSATPPPAFP